MSSSGWQSPLSFVGSKRLAVYQLAELVPAVPEVSRIVSPFFGGGSFEFYLLASRKGVSVAGSDGFQPLVNLWSCLLEDAEGVAAAYETAWQSIDGNLSEEQYWAWYKDLQRREGDCFGNWDAAVLFILYHNAFNKMLQRGTTRVVVERRNGPRGYASVLRAFGRRKWLSRLSMASGDAFGVISTVALDTPDAFLFLDPPYINGEALYGFDGRWCQGFEHAELASLLRKCWSECGIRFLLTYNDCDEVRALYSWARVEELVFPYSARRSTHRTGGVILGEEVVIRDPDSVPWSHIKASRAPVINWSSGGGNRRGGYMS